MSLAVLAVVELLFAMGGVVAGRDSSPIHDTQHLGAFGAAIAAAVLFVAWRPRFARGLLPVAITLACAIPVFALVDLANDNLSAGGVLHHLVQMLALALVWIISSGARVRVSRAPATEAETEHHGDVSPVAASSISSTR